MNKPNIIELVKELSKRCDSDSHLSEELENKLISPAELANALQIAVEALEGIAPSAYPLGLPIVWCEEDEPESARTAMEALSRIRSL